MLGVFDAILEFLKFDSIVIDNKVFFLHHKITFLFLMAFALLSTQRQYFGDPIDCYTPNHDLDFLDQYCWTQTTYTYPDHGYKNPVYVGVVPDHKGGDPKYHSYYQWVSLFIFLQAILFAIPFQLWKVWEGRKVSCILQDLNQPLKEEAEKKKNTQLLVNYILENKNQHMAYAIKFFICEFLNFVNVIGQIYFIDMFLDYEFTSLGTDVIRHSNLPIDERNVTDHLDQLFPKVTKCKFERYGASGTVEKVDLICVLPANIYNEKMFIFIWFWFVLLATVSGIALLYRMATVLLPPLRQFLLSSKAKIVPAYIITDLVKLTTIGDWFLIDQLGKNMDILCYTGFLNELHFALKKI